MPFLQNQGRRIYFERHGQGPAVLFLHGAGSNAATWWQQLPAFSADCTCLTMDIRCFGRSTAPLEEFSFEHFLSDALAVLDQNGVGTAAVIGQSLGGMIGLRMALRSPERLRAFVSCDSSLAVDHAALLDVLRQRRITQEAVNIENRSLGPWLLRNHPERAALYAQINRFNASAHSIPAADWGAALHALMEPAHLLPMADLGRVACPTLFVVGRQDPIVSPGVTQEFASLVRNSQVAVIDDAGHSAYFEQPAAFNETVRAFLRRHASANSTGEKA